MTLAFQAPMENLWNYNPFKTFPIWPRNLQPRTVSYTWALLSRELRIKLLPLLIEWPFPNIWKLRLNHILMSPLLLRHMNPVLNVSHYLAGRKKIETCVGILTAKSCATKSVTAIPLGQQQFFSPNLATSDYISIIHFCKAPSLFLYCCFTCVLRPLF